MSKTRRERTIWELLVPTLGGNAQDGWVVESTYTTEEYYELALPIRNKFRSKLGKFAYCQISDADVREALDLQGEAVEIHGISVFVIAYCKKDQRPLGAMHCVSHETLFPLRVKKGFFEPACV